MSDGSLSGDERLFVATASESQARAEAALPAQGREDVSHLLRTFSEEVLRRPGFGEEKDYLPNGKVDWVVHVDFAASVVLRKADIEKVFSRKWLNKNYRPTVFGFSPETERWTFVSAAGVPETYSRLQIAWKMRPFDQEKGIAKKQFEQYQVAIEKAASKLDAKSVRAELSATEAEKRSAALIDLAASCDQSSTVVLQAPRGHTFDGKAIWDVMLCLRLRWGDMDLFHWENPGVAGDDHLFSVRTSTPPGYFFPEEIAAGRVQTADLVFEFSIPRTFQPEFIFESMMKAVQYAQKRLGGTLVDAEGRRFSEETARSEIRNIVEKLRNAGFDAGADETL